MKTTHLSILFPFAVFVLFLSACTKDTVQTLSNSDPTATTPSFTDGYGAMVAMQTTTYVSVAGVLIPTSANAAGAVFIDTLGSQTFVDAGAVALNSKALTKQSNNSYLYDNLQNPFQLDNIVWTVEGKGKVPAINFTVTRPVPEFNGYSSLPASITKTSGLTVTLSGQLSGADSVYVAILDMKSNTSIKRVSGNAGSVVFSSSELSGLEAGQGILEVIPWNYSSASFSGKKMYFINQSVVLKTGLTIN